MNTIKIGVCYRPWLHNTFLQELAAEVDTFEVMPDATQLEDLKKIKSVANEHQLPITTHCLRSSLAQPGGYHLENVKNYFLCNEFLDSKYYSDHVAFSYFGDTYLSSVQPIAFTENNLEIVSNNLTKLSDSFDGDVLVENIVQDELKPENEMTEAIFFKKLMQNTPDNVKLLFDLTNMTVTAHNNHINFQDYIRNYPFDCVESIHVSGHTIEGSLFVDSHNVDIDDAQIDDLTDILKKCSPQFMYVERDFTVSKLSDAKRDLSKLRSAIIA